MGHILTENDFIWDVIYNFEWYKVKLMKRKMEIEDFKLSPGENVDISIDLITLKFNTRMNRFFKISTVKKII
jgi:hypothetical protein